MPLPRAFLPISFRIHSKGAPPPGSPKRAPAETDAPFREPSFNFLSKFPVKGPPSPQVPQRRERHPFLELSSTHPLIIHLSLKVHGKGAALHVPQQGPYGERCSVSSASGFFIHLYPSESPVKEPSNESGENIRLPSTEPHADPRPTCSLQHNTLHFGLGSPQPR